MWLVDWRLTALFITNRLYPVVKYSIIYEGALKYGERRKFFEAPDALQKSHFGGSKCFSTAISVQKTLANCNKVSINNG